MWYILAFVFIGDFLMSSLWSVVRGQHTKTHPVYIEVEYLPS